MSPSKYLPMFHFQFYEEIDGVIIHFGTNPKLFWNIFGPIYCLLYSRHKKFLVDRRISVRYTRTIPGHNLKNKPPIFTLYVVYILRHLVWNYTAYIDFALCIIVIVWIGSNYE